MTRAERLAQHEARTKAELDAKRRTLARVHAAQKALARRDLTQRRAQVGQLADAAGLLVLDDATLAGLFAQLTALVPVPNPVVVLARVLRDVGDMRQDGQSTPLTSFATKLSCSPPETD